MRVIKCQFGCQKVRFTGLAGNTARILTLFALSNPWIIRRTLLAAMVKVRLRSWVHPRNGIETADAHPQIIQFD